MLLVLIYSTVYRLTGSNTRHRLIDTHVVDLQALITTKNKTHT